MKILITGGAGFIGSHVSDLLAKDNELVIVDNLITGRKENIHPKAHFYQIDIKDGARLDAIFKKESPETIIHLAAQKSLTKSVEDPIYDATENIIGALTLFEAAKKHGVKKIVFSSTGGALYGETTDIPTAEEHLTLAESPYGIAKKAIEDYLRFYAAQHQFVPAILRFSNVYGPRQDPAGEAGVIAIFCSRLLKNEPLTVYGDGKQTRDYVFVGDVAEAIKKALKHPHPLTTNIATATETNVLTLIEQLADALGQEAVINHQPIRSGEVRRSALSNRQAKVLLEWQPTTTLDDGLSQTLEWFRAAE